MSTNYQTWKILDANIKVYQIPDMDSPSPFGLVAGEKMVFEAVSSGKTAKIIHKGGRGWFKVKLADGSEGYILEGVRVAALGPALHCIHCGHIELAGELKCSQCNIFFRPVRFNPIHGPLPTTSDYQQDSGSIRSSMEWKEPVNPQYFCCCCCSTTNLQMTTISGSYSDRTGSTSTSGYLKIPFYICSNCLLIRTTAQQHQHKVHLLGVPWVIFLTVVLILLITFMVALIAIFDALPLPAGTNILSSAKLGFDFLLPAKIGLVSLILCIVFFLSARYLRNTMDKLLALDKDNTLKLIRSFGSKYQPIKIIYYQHIWYLAIFNKEYARLFYERNNSSFSKMDY